MAYTRTNGWWRKLHKGRSARCSDRSTRRAETWLPVSTATSLVQRRGRCERQGTPFAGNELSEPMILCEEIAWRDPSTAFVPWRDDPCVAWLDSASPLQDTSRYQLIWLATIPDHRDRKADHLG